MAKHMMWSIMRRVMFFAADAHNSDVYCDVFFWLTFLVEFTVDTCVMCGILTHKKRKIPQNISKC